MALVPQRKNKQMLTLIPESERSIDWRFEFTIVGDGARTFAEGAVHSEMAEAFKPTAKNEASQEAAKLDHIGEDEENEEGSPDAAIPSSSLTRRQSGEKDAQTTGKDKLILFCPIGESSKALARVRFTCVEQFSDSLPLGRDAQAAMNQAIIFLFKPSSAKDKMGGRTPIDEFKSDFISRFAEINHTPLQYRPHCRILAVEAEPDAIDTLTEIGSAKNVSTDSQPDGSEEAIMEALQEICEHLIQRHSSQGTASQVMTSLAPAPTAAPPETKSRACVLL